MQCNIITLAQLQRNTIPGATVIVEDVLPDCIMLSDNIFLQAGAAAGRQWGLVGVAKIE